MDKNKAMMISLIVLLLVILASTVGGMFFLYGQLNKPADEASLPSTKPGVKELTQEQITTFELSDPISTNLLTDVDGEPHVIRLSLGIGIDNTDPKVSSEFLGVIATKEVVIRDVVLDIVCNKTYKEVSRPDGKAVLKQEILSALEETFSNNLIVEVNIGDFYTQ